MAGIDKTIVKQAKNALKIDEIEKLSQEEKRVYCQILVDSGMTHRAIGQMLDKHHSTINDWLHPERNQRYKDEVKIFKNFLLKVKEITQPTPELKNEILKIERELSRIKDIIQRKEIEK